MKFLLVTISVCLLSFNCKAINDKFVNALIKVESAGNNYAIGDNGKAVGCLQIWKQVIDDVNSFSNIKYTYSDRINRFKSIEICKKYLSHYATKSRLGRTPTLEDMARIWNGGPNGWKKPTTIAYWEKVKNHYEFQLTIV